MERIYLGFADADNQMHLTCFYDGTTYSFRVPRRGACLDALTNAQAAAELLMQHKANGQESLREAVGAYTLRVGLAHRALREGQLALADPYGAEGLRRRSDEPSPSEAWRLADQSQREITDARGDIESAMATWKSNR